LEKLKEVTPSDRVEGLLDIKFEEKRRLLPSVKPSSIVPDKHKIIMDAPRLDEGTLSNRDNLLHARGESEGENFGYNLGESILFGNKDDVCGPAGGSGRPTARTGWSRGPDGMLVTDTL
jgi:hypothetical protein